ncbi:MAG: NUDIX hydrolase [Candidatus Magnetoglobus multicellularis str. Araruama]|uniref:NUDIX hydrolase n=1 Tax=Candidatus Magnetoglobus multicellularis str. Araruama TaxID=890399 RepID=A0A1V1PG39_9BACT|nr:MAG: NUDIX hydrolase [Candidatus Magnetoglobus multicellularis str. Araruama]
MEKKFCHFCSAKLIRCFIDGRERYYCEKCQTPIYENPVPANAIVVIDNADRLLLVKRAVAPKEGYWCLPGGFMELHEKPELSALRELAEETGIHGKIDRLLGLTTHDSPRYQTILMIGYLVRQYQGVLHAGDDASDVRFFDTNSLPEIAFDSHVQFIQMYFQHINVRDSQVINS